MYNHKQWSIKGVDKLLRNNLTLTIGTEGPGEGQYKDSLFCAEFRPGDLPWKENEIHFYSPESEARLQAREKAALKGA